jgi:hypothetical protein
LWRCAKRLRELDTFFRQFVQIRRRRTATVAAQMPSCVVGDDEQNVWAVFAHRPSTPSIRLLLSSKPQRTHCGQFQKIPPLQREHPKSPPYVLKLPMLLARQFL